MRYVKVWCEYDFSGQFGGNNNEECYIVDDENMSTTMIEEKLLDMLSKSTGVDKEELFGLWDWEFIEVNHVSD